MLRVSILALALAASVGALPASPPTSFALAPQTSLPRGASAVAQLPLAERAGNIPPPALKLRGGGVVPPYALELPDPPTPVRLVVGA